MLGVALGHVNVLLYDKHPGTTFPLGPFTDEQSRGASVWTPSPGEHTELVLASVGDICARQIYATAATLLEHNPRIALRHVHVHDLTALGQAPHALSDTDFSHLFTDHAPVLLATPTYPGAPLSQLQERGSTDRFHIVGYREPHRPSTPDEQLLHSGLTINALTAHALRLIKDHP